MQGFIIPLTSLLLIGWTLIGSVQIDVWQMAPDKEKEIMLAILSKPFCDLFHCEEADLKGIPFGDTIYFFARCVKYRCENRRVRYG